MYLCANNGIISIVYFTAEHLSAGGEQFLAGYKYLLVNEKLLPPVYSRVVTAKALLASGEASSATKAASMAGISRSAYYKYKDGVFEYDPQNGGEVLTLSLRLKDAKGVLSAVTAELFRLNANVLSINQSVPKNGVADVSLAVYTAEMTADAQTLVDCLGSLCGVSAVNIS